MTRAARQRREQVSQREYQALAAFRSVLRRFLAFSETAARSAGLTPRQHQAILAIKGAPGGTATTVGDLAEQLGIRHHSAVGLVDRLSSLGLLARSHPAVDRRRVELVLTPRAGRTLERLSAVHRGELRQLAPGLAAALRALRTGARRPQPEPTSRSRRSR